jgi:hypothetical protein
VAGARDEARKKARMFRAEHFGSPLPGAAVSVGMSAVYSVVVRARRFIEFSVKAENELRMTLGRAHPRKGNS